MKKWMIQLAYYLSIIIPCVATIWASYCRVEAYAVTKAIWVLLPVVCAILNAVMRHAANKDNESQRIRIEDQSNRIRFLQCHIQPTKQMVRKTATEISRCMNRYDLKCHCDLSTREFAAVAAFPEGGKISQIGGFMRIEDFEIAEMYGAENLDLDKAVGRYMTEDIPFPNSENVNANELLRKMAVFIKGETVPLFGTGDMFFYDGTDYKVWIQRKTGDSDYISFGRDRLDQLLGRSRFDCYNLILDWCYAEGLASKPGRDVVPPSGKWS